MEIIARDGKSIVVVRSPGPLLIELASVQEIHPAIDGKPVENLIGSRSRSVERPQRYSGADHHSQGSADHPLEFHVVRNEIPRIVWI